jgi:amino acid adenylation domain-containing protein
MGKIDKFIFTGSEYEPYFAFWRKHREACANGYIFQQYTLPLASGPQRSCQYRLSAAPVEQLVGNSDAGAFLVISAAWAMLLYRYTGREHVIIDTPLYDLSSGDNAYAQRVPLVFHAQPKLSLKAWLAACQEVIRQSYQYQNFPLELLYPSDDSKPVYPSNIALHYTGLHVPAAVQGEYDLQITVTRSGPDLCFDLRYTAAFDEGFISATSGHVEKILAALGDLSVPLKELVYLSPAELELVLHTFNDTAAPFHEQLSAKECFERQVEHRPDAIALVFEDRCLSYRQLNEDANRLAHYLRNEYKLQPDDVVALMVNRHERMIIGMLGILKAGAAYMPVDPAYPRPRKDYLLQDAKVRLLLTDSEFIFDTGAYQGELFSLDLQLPVLDTPVSDPEPLHTADNLAYVIYTSGSTGQPKGVMIAHNSHINMCLEQIRHFGITAQDRVLQMASCSFDASVSEIFKTLYAGAALVLVPPVLIPETQRFTRFLLQEMVTVVTFPPSYLATLDLQQLHMLRVIISAGEAANVENAVACTSFCDYYNAYGPTECAVCVSINHVNDYLQHRNIDRNNMPVGRPIGNNRIFLLDACLQPVPVGIPGEICVAGAGLARGYLFRDGLTSEKFIEHPLGRLYRTGDWGRWLPDGNLEFLGRKDGQVKVRGYRIEIAEVELALQELEPVKQAVVALKEVNGEPCLVAWFTADVQLEPAVIRKMLKEKLPAYMEPAYFIPVEKFRLNVNGKIDKSALPDPAGVMNRLTRYVAPAGEMETALAAIWEKVLGVVQVGAEDDFFMLGGDSIKAIRLAGEMNKTFKTAIEVKDIFNHKHIRACAAFLEASGVSGRHEALRAAEAQLDAFKDSILQQPALAKWLPEGWEDFYPASDIELGMLYHSFLNPDSGIYHDQVFHQVEDACFDYELFCQAIRLLVAKHEILRTGFDFNHFPQTVQIVYKAAATKPDLGYEDISHMGQEEQRRYLQQSLAKDVENRFNVTAPGLWRMRVFRLSESGYGLLLACHHAVIDGWSDATLTTELSNVYFHLKTEPRFTLEPLKASYRDYVIDQLRQKNEPANRAFWIKEMDGYERTELPFHRAVNRISGNKKTNIYTFFLQPALGRSLSQFSAETNVPVKHLLFTAFLYLIKTVTGSRDITVGLVSNGRPDKEDADRMLGCFLNTVPFRYRFENGDQTLYDFLMAVHEQCIALKSYDRLSLPSILELAGQPTTGLNPIFDLSFNFVDFHIQEEAHANAVSKMPAVTGNGTNNTPLAFSVKRSGDHIRINVVHLLHLFSDTEIRRLADYYQQILSAIPQSANTSLKAVQVVHGTEREKLLRSFQGSRTAFPDQTISALFENVVARQPESPALVFEDKMWTYAALNEMANRLANYLRAHYQVQPDTLLPVIMDRSEWMIIAILGILKAGAAYVPIAHDNPAERTRFILDDLGASLLLTDRPVDVSSGIEVLHLPEVWPVISTSSPEDPVPVNTPADLAYAIYTSGTTGQPKGTLVSHRSGINMSWDQMRTLSVTAADNIIQFFSFSFDASTYEIFMAFYAGATLVLVRKDVVNDVGMFVSYMQDRKVTLMVTTPSYLNLLALDRLAFLRVIVTGGETPNVANGIHCAGITNYYNAYGPTECAVAVSIFKVEKDRDRYLRNLPVGKPVANMQVYVLDEHLRPIPLGVPGELYVEGAGLARGYLNRPELTAERFVENPFDPGARLYRTGDIGRWLEDGNLEFLGRADTQVKINGYRVELREIQQVMMNYRNVKDAVVLVKEHEGKGKYLAAFVTVSANELDTEELRNFLGKYLPKYMVPASVTIVSAFPLTQHGKIDERRLAQEERMAYRALAQDRRPGNETEALLLEVWQEVLGITQMGTQDNFFDVGGNSINIVRLFNRLSTHYPELKMADLFAYPTISLQAGFLHREKDPSQLLMKEGFDV